MQAMTHLPELDDKRRIFHREPYPSAAQRTACVWLAALVLVLMVLASAHAQDAYECGTYAVRAAWGAEARLRSAPLVFQYRPMELIKRYAMGELPFPNDGIYIAQELDDEERVAYEDVAQTGWLVAANWRDIFRRKSVPTHEWVVAYFMEHCPYRPLFPRRKAQ